MSMRTFIRTFRAEIDSVIRGYGITGTINDDEREEWIGNDTGLYAWAEQMGVKV